MKEQPVSYEHNGELFVWCIDERGALRAVSLHGTGDPDDDVRSMGMRYATRHEVATLPRTPRPA
jgi:hypothetical protein